MSIVCDFFIIITRNQTTCGTDEIFRRKEMGTRYTKPIQHGMDGSDCKEYQLPVHRSQASASGNKEVPVPSPHPSSLGKCTFLFVYKVLLFIGQKKIPYLNSLSEVKRWPKT